jgi:uncharacterized protein YecT (DUF1311 family)
MKALPLFAAIIAMTVASALGLPIADKESTAKESKAAATEVAEEKHPIDREYDECMEKHSSTAGMVECTDKAYKKWDAELNRAYGELLKKLPAKKAAILKQSQRDWLIYRDANFRLIDAIYDELQGTMYIPMRLYAKLRIVRERALLLSGYVELMGEAGQ